MGLESEMQECAAPQLVHPVVNPLPGLRQCAAVPVTLVEWRQYHCLAPGWWSMGDTSASQ